MADIRLRVGGITSSIAFGKSDSEVAQILRWLIAEIEEPIPEEWTQQEANQYRLDLALHEVVRLARREARRVRLTELRSQGTLEAQADEDTEL